MNKNDIVTAVPRDIDISEAVFGSDYRHIGFSGEGEDIFQVWTNDEQMVVSSYVFHVDDSIPDHLSYQTPIDYQAKARHEYH